MLSPHKFKARRTGFSLVEILVVIGIITVLVGLLAAGIFAVIGSQKNSSTAKTMKAVHTVLVRQMKFVLDAADKEAIPGSVTTMANNDPKLARVIWKKLKLKQAFPMTFAEAVAPYLTYGGAVSPVLATDLPPLPAYTKALGDAGIATQNAATGAWSVVAGKSANSAAQPFIESSTLILLALSQSRGGVSFQVDTLGPYALDTNKDGLKELIDGWGTPIAFFRFPTSNDDATIPLNNDLDSQNPAPANSTAASYRDPYDPQGYLQNKTWNSENNYKLQAGVYWFEQLCHLVHTPNESTYPAVPTLANYKPWSTYMLPTLVSAGPDLQWGLNSSFSASLSTSPLSGFYTSGVNPDMSILDPTLLKVSPTTNKGVGPSNDNIYSYRIGLGLE